VQIQLQINEKNADFFLQYLNSLKDGIVEKVVISQNDNPDFVVADTAEVHRRISAAEKNGDYQNHDDFWAEIGT
jgi:hypothetical protein